MALTNLALQAAEKVSVCFWEERGAGPLHRALCDGWDVNRLPATTPLLLLLLSPSPNPNLVILVSLNKRQ